MKMIIKNIEYNNNIIYIIGDTSIGKIKGKWCYKEHPILNKEYYFELDIDDIDRSEISVINLDNFSSNVSLCNDSVLFKGVCEEIDDIYVIRFSVDWIEMIGIENDDFTIKKGDCISFSKCYENIGIYPY